MKKNLVVLISLVLVSVMSLQAVAAESSEEGISLPAETAAVDTARPSVNGRLHVEGTLLKDETGQAVQLRGISTHGLLWYPDMISEALFRRISADWNCSLIRLAMYSEAYCAGEQEQAQSLELLHRGIEAAVAADMYVLVDWHIISDSDPRMHQEAAEAFFDRISVEYADCPNVIYEICNEPNGETC